MYQALASNLLPSLLKGHDKSRSELNSSHFLGEELRLYDVVFDEKTFKTTKNIRASIYTIVYISKDKKSILIYKPKTHILSKSLYPNSKVAQPDLKYTKANLHL